MTLACCSSASSEVELLLRDDDVEAVLGMDLRICSRWKTEDPLYREVGPTLFRDRSYPILFSGRKHLIEQIRTQSHDPGSTSEYSAEIPRINSISSLVQLRDATLVPS
ncbi:hypothetical protein GIB67_026654 [Kingdonia uniflora]|uniref:Uncharacterized protein n=1 Tax=Kingdonia uniflora TaxID=39325 RepID=A0A7J7N494_9MAGN|nr:hypothetical protein GIB67_026654 [Kingdonia uniflora]